MLSAFRELRGYGYLFRTFFRRDLSARYKASVLGIVWSLLNPLMMMIIYTFVFAHVLNINQPDYSAWFITGFLPWFFFSTALSMGASTLVGHSTLITKVYFPRELLPLSMTAANLVNMRSPMRSSCRTRSGSGASRSLPSFFDSDHCCVLRVHIRDRDAALRGDGLLPRVEFLIGIVLTAWFYVVPVIYSFDNDQGTYAPRVDGTRSGGALHQRVPAGRLLRETVSVSGMIMLYLIALTPGSPATPLQQAQGADRGGAVNEHGPAIAVRDVSKTSASTGVGRRPSRRRC